MNLQQEDIYILRNMRFPTLHRSPNFYNAYDDDDLREPLKYWGENEIKTARDTIFNSLASPNLGGNNNSLSWKKAGLLTTLFWSSSTLLQRFSGLLLGIHAGRSYPLTVMWGIISTTCSLSFSQRATTVLIPYIPDLPDFIPGSEFFTPKNKHGLWGPRSTPPLPDLPTLWRRFVTCDDASRQETILQTMAGLGCYVALERRAFRTAIPSSVITTGVFAHTPLHWRWSKMKDVVVASSAVATSGERNRIQRLGILHGCHHCGSRQLSIGSLFRMGLGFAPFSRFIADHMPPTKTVLQMNAARWRAFFNVPAKQQLLPQCQSCFSIQGLAVKQGQHRIVYHTQFRAWHWAPVLAMALLMNPETRTFGDPVARSLNKQYTKAKRALEDILEV